MHGTPGIAVVLTARTIDVTKENPFFGTELHNEFVYQSYWNERNYFVSGLMRKLLTTAELGA